MVGGGEVQPWGWHAGLLVRQDVASMSFAANPNRVRKTREDTEAAAAARQLKADKERIRRLLITIGDDVTKKVAGQIRGLAGALEDDVDAHGALLHETVLDCVKHLPLKTGIYAAFLARMRAKHADWCNDFVPQVMEALRAAVRTGQSSTAQLLLRFLVALGNCGELGITAVCTLLQEVLALSEGLRPAKGGDLGVFLALGSLPFVSPAAYAKSKEKIEELINQATAGYLATRNAQWKPVLRVLQNDDRPDGLEALVHALKSQKEAEWRSVTVMHPPGFEPVLEVAEGHAALPALGVTADEVRKSKVRVQIPLSSPRLMKTQDDGADDDLSLHDRWVLEDYLVTTIEMFGRDVEECTKQVLRIPVFHPQFETILVEMIFLQMLRLPSPNQLPLFYSRLLETVMQKQDTTRPLVKQCFKALIQRAPDLDEEGLDVLSEAFAYHLMLNGYEADWSLFTGDNVSDPALRFVRRTLERLQRLSFHQNLLHRLPEALHVYVPPEPLAATGLAPQEKGEYVRMLSFAKIKDADPKKVIAYCEHLRKKAPAKDEAGPPLAEPVGASVAAPEENANEPDAKRRKTNDGDAVQGGGEEDPPAEAAKEGDGAAAPSIVRDAGAVSDDDDDDDEAEGSRKRRRPQAAQEVKEEPKDEDQGNTSKAAASTGDVLAVSKPKEEEKEESKGDDFGEAPSEPWSLEEVVELFFCAALQNGSRTPTHLCKVLDSYASVFEALRPEAEDDVHEYMKVIARCVFAFWARSAQRVEITMDALLHRGILSPKCAVEHALADRGPQGCDSVAVWNLLNGVARKSLEQSQTVRVGLAMAKKEGKTDELEGRRRDFENAIQETAELFTIIFTGLVRNHQDFEETNASLRRVMSQRILAIGRKYHAFVKPLIDAAESRVPGVAHQPEIAAIFQSLSLL